MKRTATRFGLFLSALVALGLLGAPAQAIPGDGAGPDTPGTSASVSPRVVAAGQTLSFTLSGFPGGETVYIKIDDGQACSASSVHGACVVHQQAIPASGTVSGSFVVPSDLAVGAHWLRFLASEEVTNAQGEYAGTKGYTHRGGADFTVVRGSGTSSSGGGGGTVAEPGNESNATGVGAAVTGGTTAAPAGRKLVLSIPEDAVAGPEPETEAPAAVPDAATEPETETGTETETETETEPEASAEDSEPQAAADEDAAVPVVGLAGLLVCLLGAGGVVLVRRRRHA